jgi:hypothetical protein
LTEQDWAIRHFIYSFFVAYAHPPTVAETAAKFSLTEVEAIAAFDRLNAGHAIFLEPGTQTLRMANPLSAVPTPYRVRANDQHYWANCAWDSLGIPAMLHADAEIEAHDVLSDRVIRYAIKDGVLIGETTGIVHFLKPFAHWYDDLIDT